MTVKTENLQVTNSAILPPVTAVAKSYGAKTALTTNSNLIVGFASLDTSGLGYVYFPVLAMTATILTAGSVNFTIDITDFVKSSTKGRKITEINVVYQIKDVDLSSHTIKISAGNYANAGGITGEVLLASSNLQTTQNAADTVYKTNFSIASPAITNYDQYIAQITFNIANTGTYQFNILQVIGEENFY